MTVFFISTNNGSSWTDDNNGFPSELPSGLRANGSDLFALSNDCGVFLSTNNGSNWGAVSAGLGDATVLSLVTCGQNLFAGTQTLSGTGDVFLSTDNGTSWTAACTGLMGFPEALLATDSNLFVGTNIADVRNPSGVFHSTNNGTFWMAMDNGLVDTTIYNNINGQDTVVALLPVNAFALSGTNLFAATNGGVFLSQDSGKNWSAASSILGGYRVSCFAVSGTNIIAGGVDSVFSSTNNGANWKLDTGGFTNISINALTIIGTNILAGTTDRIFRSTDSGVSWMPADSGLEDTESYQYYVSSFAAYGTNVFAGTRGGIFLSTNYGTSWSLVDSGLSIGDRSLAVNGSYLFAGGTNVWRRPLSDFGISSALQTPSISNPEIQIYPNPFSQSTQITCTSQTAGYVEVSIVNMLGVEVARLFSGEAGAGEHSFLWGNPTGLPDGVYECLFRMNGQMETLPVLLMR